MEDLVTTDGAFVAKALNVASRSIDFICSTDAQDSHGDVVDQESWVLNHYEANPIVLYAHNSRELPIGTASNVGVRGGRLEATIKFASAEANPRAEEVWRLIQEGVLRAVSVGFMPTDGRYEMRGGEEIFVWRSPVLKEISVVPIGANHEALARSKSLFAKAHGQLTEHERLSAVAKITKTNPPAPAGTQPTAEEEKTKMDLTAALAKIEAQAKEIGTLTTDRDGGVKLLALGETALADVRGKLAVLVTEKAALETQNAALVVERDAASAKLAVVEAAAIEVEVETLVGKKILPAEKEVFLDLRKSSPALFAKMVAQRADLPLLEEITTKGAKANGAAKGAGDTSDLLAEVTGATTV